MHSQPSFLMWEGKTISLIFSILPKAVGFISFKPSGNSIDVIDLQSEKALSPIDSTLEGITNLLFSNFNGQFTNTSLPIDVILSGKLTVCNDEQS